MASGPWEISAEEHVANKTHFAAAGPVQGKLNGAAARTVMMKSGLPANILAQIWALSDLDHDGQLDEREFSIAMRLTRNCLQGLPLPPQLPQSMLATTPASIPMPVSSLASMSSLSMSPPVMQSMNQSVVTGPLPPAAYNTAPAAVMQNALRGGFSTGPWTTGRQCGNWAVPHQKKLNYCQQFNQLDKQRLGWLAGNVARNAMGQSGLPMPTLAHIWNLSDVNKDGRLNVDEFCIASFLIEMHKDGFALPDSTPLELIQMCGGERTMNESPLLEPGAPPPQKVSTPRTFEDKRRDNFDKGQAELERRRQILREEEERRRAEIEKREREEAERKERERLEKERRREEERQLEMERQRILEEHRLEEERKREMEREHIRKEQERLRMVELEKIRIKEMQAQKEREAEQNAQRQQRQKTLGFQLQALDEKAVDMNNSITQARSRIEDITHEIEGMRGQRDEKMRRIQELQLQHQQLSVRSQELAHALLQMQSANRETTGQLEEMDRMNAACMDARANTEQLKTQVQEARSRTQNQAAQLQKKQEEVQAVRPAYERTRAEYAEKLNFLLQLQDQARNIIAQKAEVCRKAAEEEQRLKLQQQQQATVPSVQESHPVMSNGSAKPAGANPFAVAVAQSASTPHGGSLSAPLPASSATGTAKYRAKYEFVSRTEDELSFNEGDIILVFEGHASEPGWLAGQIRDKVGWFPAAFAEPLAPVNTNITQPIQSASEVAASPSLERITEEAEPSADHHHSTAVAAITQSITKPQEDKVVCVCIAQFPWKARNEGDLSFAKGDTIEVLEQTEMKWRGRKSDGATGWFPKSYVKLQQASTPVSTPSAETKALPVSSTAPLPAYDVPPGDVPSSQSNHSLKTAFIPSQPQPPMYDAPPGDIGSPSALPSYDTPPGDVPSSQSQHSLAEAAWPVAHQQQEQPHGEWFVAQFDFDAVESGDLPLKSGDKILVIEQQDQWWKGVSNGREGMFPANYVKKAEVGQGLSASSFHGTERARALVEFTASAPNQLALRPGDVITVRSKSEQGWWEGETIRDGKIHAGWFPGNYVQVEGGSTISPSGDMAVAMFDYEATQPDELSFKTGDKIVVTSRHDADWWAGHLMASPATSGLFPVAYVQVHVGSPVDEDSLR